MLVTLNLIDRAYARSGGRITSPVQDKDGYLNRLYVGRKDLDLILAARAFRRNAMIHLHMYGEGKWSDYMAEIRTAPSIDEIWAEAAWQKYCAEPDI